MIASRPYVCVMPPGSRLAGRSDVRLEDLAGAPLVAFSPAMSLRQNVDQLFAAAGVRPNYRLAAQTIESMCALVAEGCGLAIIHPFAAHIARVFGLHTATVANSAELELFAITPAPPFQQRAAADLIKDVQAIIGGQAG